MSGTRTILVLTALTALLLAAGACTTTPGAPSEYYRRGSIHNDSFPPGYVPGGHHGPVGHPWY
jgi:hypothetical protein